MPLEVIIAVYGMLLRQQVPHTVTDNAEYEDFSSRSVAEATAMRSTSSDTSPASGVSVSPLGFIAYASQQHPSLNPIAVILGADKGCGVGNAREQQHSHGVHEDAHGGISPLSLPFPPFFISGS